MAQRKQLTKAVLKYQYCNIMNKLINYLKKSREELGKVAWPSKQTTLNHTGIVIVISIAVAIFLGAIDYILNKILQLVI